MQSLCVLGDTQQRDFQSTHEVEFWYLGDERYGYKNRANWDDWNQGDPLNEWKCEFSMANEWRENDAIILKLILHKLAWLMTFPT